jgi:hypothetical protein
VVKRSNQLGSVKKSDILRFKSKSGFSTVPVLFLKGGCSVTFLRAPFCFRRSAQAFGYMLAELLGYLDGDRHMQGCHKQTFSACQGCPIWQMDLTRPQLGNTYESSLISDSPCGWIVTSAFVSVLILEMDEVILKADHMNSFSKPLTT